MICTKIKECLKTLCTKIKKWLKKLFIKDKKLDIINAYMKKNYCYEHMYRPIKPIECFDGFSFSCQAGWHCYSIPRGAEAWPYSHFELGFPNRIEPLIEAYAEDKDDLTHTVYPYVPVDVVMAVVKKHGGIKN